MSEANKALVRGYIDQALNHGILSAIDEAISPAYVTRGYTRSPGLTAQESYKSGVNAWRAAFPDLHVRFEEMLAEGDIVVYWSTWSGTHKGPFRGVAPTGRRAEWKVVGFRRIQDGKVVEGWGTVDLHSLLQQLTAEMPANP